MLKAKSETKLASKRCFQAFIRSNAGKLPCPSIGENGCCSEKRRILARFCSPHSPFSSHLPVRRLQHAPIRLHFETYLLIPDEVVCSNRAAKRPSFVLSWPCQLSISASCPLVREGFPVLQTTINVGIGDFGGCPADVCPSWLAQIGLALVFSLSWSRCVRCKPPSRSYLPGPYPLARPPP